MSSLRRSLLVLALVALLSAPAMADHSWGNYHWARSGNLVVDLGDNVSSAWDAYLDDADVDWSASSVLDTNIVAGGTRPRTCKATLGRAEVCNSTYGNNGWLGLASIWANGDHITQATVKVNDTYFNTATYNTPAWRRLVMCQEVGHVFGLDHQDENFNNAPLGTCMDYSNDPNPNQHPNAHDYDQLETIYAHSDFTVRLSQPPAAFYKVNLDSPAEWGELIHRSADGSSSRYLLDFGNGWHIVTEVFWVPGHAPNDDHGH